jgi:hypothetical protein
MSALSGVGNKDHSMRFKMIEIPKEYESAAPDTVPSSGVVAKMQEYRYTAKDNDRSIGITKDGPFCNSVDICDTNK